ncbi:MAG: NAD(P)-dependent oxidoreductase [Polyangiales bacterium]
MKIVVTGSAGHLGEALVRTLQATGHEVLGVDVLASPFTQRVASIADRLVMRECLQGANAVLHAATLHKPHVATHSNQQFIDVNLTGTLTLLEEASAAGVGAFVFTSTTSTFGRALSPAEGQPAAWITEDVVPVPKNIYGVTKVAAESLCELFHRMHGLPVLILKTSRFFPEEDDDPEMRRMYSDDNSKLNELLFRRVDIEDVVSAHLLALDKARALGFGRYIISATSPFTGDDLAELRRDAPVVVQRYAPEYHDVYTPLGYRMFATIDRVYVNTRARRELGWQPKHDFASALRALRAGGPLQSELARVVGAKGYHRHA